MRDVGLQPPASLIIVSVYVVISHEAGGPGMSTRPQHRVWTLLVDSWERFSRHGDMLAAATSFYALLSVAPLFVVAIGVAGLVFDRADARASMLRGLRRVASPEVTDSVTRLPDAAERQDSQVAAVVAVLLLLWAASRFFLQVQDALNITWGVTPVESKGVIDWLRRVAIKRLVSLAMVLGCGALLLSTLLLQTILAALGELTHAWREVLTVAPGLLMLQQLAFSFVVLTCVFTLIYRVLPDAQVRFADVWVGGALTSALTLLGTWLLGLLLSSLSPAWLQGAIGSVAAFVLWTYYASQVFLLGAAFTRTWSCRRGAAVVPESYARSTEEGMGGHHASTT